MAGPTVVVRILGDIQNLAKSFTSAKDKGTDAAKSMHAAFSGVLGALNQTGVLGPFGDALNGIDQALDAVSEHAKGVGLAMVGVGSAVAGIGVGLSALGSTDQAAHQQLQSAIAATGKSYDDYSDKIEAAIKHQEHFGDTAAQTQDALRILTQATKDPAKALGMLSEATDLAAAKHEDLGTAATQLGMVYNGSTKILKQFGIAVVNTKASTTALASATKQSQTADAGLAAAKQHLVDLQARLAAGNSAQVVSTAGVTAAQNRLAAAQQHLSELEAEDAGKKKLTIAQQFALRDAHQAVTKAVGAVGVAQGKYSAALEKAADKTHLTVAQEQELRNAHTRVTDAAAKAQAAHAKLAAAQGTASAAAKKQGSAVGDLAKVIHGQGEAAADTFGGKIKALKAHLEDTAATLGQKYGPAITAAGTAMAGLGAIVTTATSVSKAFADAKKVETTVTEATTVATDAADVSMYAGLAPILLIIAATVALGIAAYAIYRNWKTIWGFIKGIVVDVWDWIKANWPLLLGILLGPIALAVVEIVKHWQAISDAFKTALAAIKTAWSVFVAWLTGLAAAIARIATGMWHGISDAFHTALSGVTGAWGSFVAWIAGLGAGIARLTSGMWNGITGAFNTALGAVQTAWGTFWGWITGIPGAIDRWAVGMWDGMIAPFQAMLGAIIRLWNQLHFTLPKVTLPKLLGGGTIGGESFGVPQLPVPHLAQGGLITNDGLVYAHAGEVISPTPGSVRNGHSVNVERAYFSSDIDIDSFMRKAAWAVRTAQI